MNVVELAELEAQVVMRDHLALVDTTTLEMFTRLLADLKLTHRMYYLSPELIRTEIWGAIREHEDLTDLVMRGTLDFNIRMLGHDETALSKYASVVGRSLTSLSSTSASKTCTDVTFIEKLSAEPLKVKDLLMDEGWVLFLLTLARRPSLVRNSLPAPVQPGKGPRGGDSDPTRP